jgi:hypothetical protein
MAVDDTFAFFNPWLNKHPRSNMGQNPRKFKEKRLNKQNICSSIVREMQLIMQNRNKLGPS